MKLTRSAIFVEFCYDGQVQEKKDVWTIKKKKTVGRNSICLVSKACGEHRILLFTKGRKTTQFLEIQKGVYGEKLTQVSGLKSYPEE